MVSCQKGPTRVGPFWQNTLDIKVKIMWLIWILMSKKGRWTSSLTPIDLIEATDLVTYLEFRHLKISIYVIYLSHITLVAEK